MGEKEKEEEFSFVIARPWYEYDNEKSLCAYTFHNNAVHSGTIEQAEELRELAKERSDEDYEYNIYKLVKV